MTAPFSTSLPNDSSKKNRDIVKDLKVIFVNCNSIQSIGKREELQALIADHNPHLILGQESKVCPEHLTNEVFPSNFTIFWKDRKAGGGGIFTMLRDDIEYVKGAFDELQTDNEIVWNQLKLPGTKLLNIASVYRPPNSQIEQMNKLQDHLMEVHAKYNATYVGGDLNLTCVDWVEEATSNNYSTHDKQSCLVFLDMLDDLGVSQHCKEVTRPASQKTLDLMLTNKPGTVTEVKSLPDMSNHNTVCANFKLATTRNKLHQHKMFKYNKADWNNVREVTKQLATNYFERDKII